MYVRILVETTNDFPTASEQRRRMHVLSYYNGYSKDMLEDSYTDQHCGFHLCTAPHRQIVHA